MENTKICIEDGLILRASSREVVSVNLCRMIARANGYSCAETFIEEKEGQTLTLNDDTFVIVEPKADIDQMFAADETTVVAKASELAEHIAIEDDALAKMDRELKDRKAKLSESKETLAGVLIQAGLKSIKLESGLSPSVQIDRKIFKASGVADDQVFEWLREKDLGDIIKPYVHYQTLQSTLKMYENSGKELPSDLFNTSDQRTVRMNGKSKFIAERNG